MFNKNKFCGTTHDKKTLDDMYHEIKAIYKRLDDLDRKFRSLLDTLDVS